MTIRQWVCTLFLVTLAASAAGADTLLIIKEGTRIGHDGSATASGKQNVAEADAQTVHFWSRSDRIARVDDAGKMIGDLNTGMLYLVNDEAKTCDSISTRETSADPEVLRKAAAAVNVRKTGASRQIGSWHADAYELDTGEGDDRIEVKVWVSEDVSVPPAQRAYMERVATPETAWMLTLFDLGGFPVRQEARIGPMNTWAELVSVEEKAAPAGTFEIPGGCK